MQSTWMCAWLERSVPIVVQGAAGGERGHGRVGAEFQPATPPPCPSNVEALND